MLYNSTEWHVSGKPTTLIIANLKEIMKVPYFPLNNLAAFKIA